MVHIRKLLILQNIWCVRCTVQYTGTLFPPSIGVYPPISTNFWSHIFTTNLESNWYRYRTSIWFFFLMFQETGSFDHFTDNFTFSNCISIEDYITSPRWKKETIRINFFSLRCVMQKDERRESSCKKTRKMNRRISVMWRLDWISLCRLTKAMMRTRNECQILLTEEQKQT